MILRLFFTLILAAALLPVGAASAQDRFEINFIPIDLETYMAVTPESIARAAFYTAQVHPSDLRLKEVLAIVEKAPPGPPLEEWFVRARIRFPDGRAIYLDKTGGLRLPERDADLDERALDQIAVLLARLTGADEAGGRIIPTHDAGRSFTWAHEAAQTHVAETKGWPRSDYTTVIHLGRMDFEAGLVIVKVRHHDDGKVFNPETGVLLAGSGKSFELHFDPLTRDLVRTIRYQ